MWCSSFPFGGCYGKKRKRKKRWDWPTQRQLSESKFWQRQETDGWREVSQFKTENSQEINPIHLEVYIVRAEQRAKAMHL